MLHAAHLQQAHLGLDAGQHALALGQAHVKVGRLLEEAELGPHVRQHFLLRETRDVIVHECKFYTMGINEGLALIYMIMHNGLSFAMLKWCIVCVCCAGDHLCEVNLSHDPLGWLLVLVLLPHVLQRGVMAAQL